MESVRIHVHCSAVVQDRCMEQGAGQRIDCRRRFSSLTERTRHVELAVVRAGPHERHGANGWHAYVFGHEVRALRVEHGDPVPSVAGHPQAAPHVGDHPVRNSHPLAVFGQLIIL